MNIDNKFTILPQVMAREVGKETVLLDLASGMYFGLDSVGTRIWQLIKAGKSIAQICDQMVEEYDVPREVLEEDAFALVHDLVEKKLITQS